MSLFTAERERLGLGFFVWPFERTIDIAKTRLLIGLNDFLELSISCTCTASQTNFAMIVTTIFRNNFNKIIENNYSNEIYIACPIAIVNGTYLCGLVDDSISN